MAGHFILQTLAVLSVISSAVAATNQLESLHVKDSYIITLRQSLPDTRVEAHLKWVDDTHQTNKIARRDTDLAGLQAVFNVGEFRGYGGDFDEDTINEIRSHPEVVRVERNQIVGLHSTTMLENSTWGLGTISSRNPGNAEYLFDSSAGQETWAYVLDTGVNIRHHDFGGRAVKGADCGNVLCLPGGDYNDTLGHGTHVAGIIAGTRYGVAKKANIVDVKIARADNTITVLSTVSALSWAFNDMETKGRTNRSIVNLPHGCPYTPYWGIRGHEAELDVIEMMYQKGVLTVVAAGNDNTDASWVAPAAAPNALTVGAIDRRWKEALFSNYGRSVDILAPGVGILSAGNRSDVETRIFGGTSMATPHVTGLALYLKALENITDPEVLTNRILGLASSTSLRRVKRGSPNLVANNGILDKRPAEPSNTSSSTTPATVGSSSTSGVGVVVPLPTGDDSSGLPTNGTYRPPMNSTYGPSPIDDTPRPTSDLVPGSSVNGTYSTSGPPIDDTPRPTFDVVPGPPVDVIPTPPTDVPRPPINDTYRPPVNDPIGPPTNDTPVPIDYMPMPTADVMPRPPINDTYRPPVDDSIGPPTNNTDDTPRPTADVIPSPTLSDWPEPSADGSLPPPIDAMPSPPVDDTIRPPSNDTSYYMPNPTTNITPSTTVGDRPGPYDASASSTDAMPGPPADMSRPPTEYKPDPPSSDTLRPTSESMPSPGIDDTRGPLTDGTPVSPNETTPPPPINDTSTDVQAPFLDTTDAAPSRTSTTIASAYSLPENPSPEASESFTNPLSIPVNQYQPTPRPQTDSIDPYTDDNPPSTDGMTYPDRLPTVPTTEAGPLTAPSSTASSSDSQPTASPDYTTPPDGPVPFQDLKEADPTPTLFTYSAEDGRKLAEAGRSLFVMASSSSLPTPSAENINPSVATVSLANNTRAEINFPDATTVGDGEPTTSWADAVFNHSFDIATPSSDLGLTSTAGAPSLTSGDVRSHGYRMVTVVFHGTTSVIPVDLPPMSSIDVGSVDSSASAQATDSASSSSDLTLAGVAFTTTPTSAVDSSGDSSPSSRGHFHRNFGYLTLSRASPATAST
ncbi:putative subtilisin-like protease [Ophiocordyceps polyrhachis-furcata BCC 54312]|uniref:Subtilisin-like protease n=1 Tax=Ophiocordyceps polyrhachis-furcata BCC 54312 TaxID=1330021 RepID=A0A367LBG9_9HYPO|nr:putative subtilisin-like protease [Ophiocordyceps polyrhachis-furcata BCC 54312]